MPAKAADPAQRLTVLDAPPMTAVASVFRAAPVGMLLATVDGAAFDANDAWCTLTGLSVTASLGFGWLDVLATPDQAVLQRLVANAPASPPHPSVDTGLAASAPIRWARWRVSRTLPFDGAELAVLVTLTDMTADHELVAQLRHEATHDPLTGAANRSLFVEAIRHSLARLRRHPGSVGILFVDIDGFKTVNDRWGHAAGDRVLITQAHRLRDALRPADVLARLGGDEFAVLCEDVHAPRQIKRIACRAASGLAKPIVDERGCIEISASVGAVVTSTPSAAAEHLIDVADRAMYRAKQRGGPPEVIVELDGAEGYEAHGHDEGE